MSAAVGGIGVTFFFSYAADKKREECLDLAALATRIRDTTQRAKDHLPWLKLGRFGDQKTDMGSYRSDANVLCITGVEADYDGGKMSFEEARQLLLTAGLLAIIYTSPSHRAAKPRWRVLCPLSAEYPPGERGRFMGRLNGLFEGIFSDESWTLSQSYYYGSVKRNPDHQAVVLDGKPIDLADELDGCWRGKPNTKPNTKPSEGNGADHSHGPADTAALLQAIRDGRDYHRAMMRVLGQYSRNGTSMVEARRLLTDAMESVFPPDRDERWRRRMDDLERCLADVYGRDAEKRGRQEPPPAAGRSNGPDHDEDPRPEPPPESEPESGELKPIPWVYRDPTTIPPREWLVGTILIRGYATVLGSTGGVGKTAYAVALALSYITGRRDILDLHVFKPGKVWLLSLEDDRLELERRVAAAMLFHEIKPEDVTGKLFINTASERPILLARADKEGVFVTCEDAALLKSGIEADGIGLTIIDPMVKSHALIENSNEHMDKLIALSNRVAELTKSAILIPAHFRKGTENGARDAIRGGGALIDGARIARTLVPMDAEEAESLGLPAGDAFRHVRVVDAKANLAPKSAASWFFLESVSLGNTTADPVYPAGDHVQSAVAWKPPAPFDGLDLHAMELIFAKLRAGPGGGWFYSTTRQAKHWAGKIIVSEAGKSPDQAAEILALWLKNGLLSEEPYKSPSRNEGTKIVVIEAKVSEMLAPLRDRNTGFSERE